MKRRSFFSFHVQYGWGVTKMVLETHKNGLLTGLAPDLVENGVGILQYADDTILCVSHDPEKAINLKLVLFMFELMSGLKFNFSRSEFFSWVETILLHGSILIFSTIMWGSFPRNILVSQ
jgi:hypothetical protein